MHMMEDYCKYVYQFSQNLHYENFCRKMTKKISQILNSVRNDNLYDISEERNCLFSIQSINVGCDGRYLERIFRQ